MSDDDETPLDRRLRDFAHEIRTPFNAMIGYTHLIASELDTDTNIEKLREYNETVRESTVRLLRICERVLDEAVSGKAAVNKTPVDMKGLAKGVAETFMPLARDKKISIKTEFSDNFPEILSDPLLVEQVLSNLVSNAIKYSPPGGSITIRGEIDQKNRAMVFVIRDTGKGIPLAVISKLRRGEDLREFAAPGEESWGRGLSISQELVSRLSGELVFAPGDGDGAIVMVRLPID